MNYIYLLFKTYPVLRININFENMKCLNWLILVMFIPPALPAQNNWIFQKEKDGIKISNRHSATSPFNDVRVEVDLPGSIDQLAAILLDVNKYTEWAYATRKSELIKKLGPGKLIYYSEIDVPWPATDRYYYGGFELQKDPSGRAMEVVSYNINYKGPVPKDLLRIPYSKGNWKVTQISKKIIHVEYILELDPGGSLPAWVINLFSTKGPLETFENIKKMMVALNP
jgi:hypothetical protein